MRNTLCAVALTMLSVAFGMTAFAQQPVLQRGYDAGLSGANLTETTLTASNVSPNTFGLVFKLPVDDRIYAQPLYVPNVVMMQGTHNVVYIATMSDTLYAFDADVGGSPLWSVNFASSVGAVPVAFANFTFAGNTNIVGNLGILSTPVIDPSTHIMYLVACTLEGGTMVYRLHAVDITNGTEPLTNVVISGSYGGVTFDAPHQTQRASLALSGGQVVFGFAAVEAETDDEGGYTGWVMAYNEQTLVQSGAFATITTGGTLGGGVWQSGRPPVVDSGGFVYVFTGNGYTNGYNGVSNFSESVLKLNPANGLALVDWFTPSNWSSLDSADLDLSSSGPLLVPGTSPSLLAGGGKAGVLYLLNTTNLQHYNATDKVVQEETIGASSLRGGPVYWQRSVANGGPLLYDWASSDWVKAYAFNGATFGSSPAYQGSGTQIYPGGILALSANGQTQGSGVLWATVAASGNVYNDATDPGVLYAFDADNVATELYSSTTNSTDNFGTFAKFVPPLVANGKVYVATFSDQVAVYGLLSQSRPTAATPTFTPTPGSYAGAQSVTLIDSTPGAAIYYTLNGTTPTTNSTKYSAAIPISANTTIEAIAVASGYTNSPIASGTYTITNSTTPVSVNLASADNVDGIANAGTAVPGSGMDGGGNAYAEALLGTSLTWAGSTFRFGGADTADAVSSTTITLPAGSYVALNMLATGVEGNQVNQTFVVTYSDGTTSTFTQSLSDWFTPQNYAGETEVLQMPYRIYADGSLDNRPFYLYGYSFALNSAKTVQSLTLPNNRDVVVLAVDVVPAGSQALQAATPTFTPTPGSYAVAQSVTLSDTTSGAVIYYTTNGTPPTTSSAQYVPGTPLSISVTTTIEAMAVESGYSNSLVASGTYTITNSTTPVSVSLASADNVDGIANAGTAVPGGGMDGGGNAYAEALLGTSLTWAGSTFTFGGADTADAVSSTTITLPAGGYAALNILATGVEGNQVNQTFVVRYSDGTTSTFTQSLSDWFTPQNYTGETEVLQMSYRIYSNGSVDNQPFYLYGYSFALNSAKTVQSLTLPNNRDVVVLAVDVVPAGSQALQAATPTFTPTPGSYTGAQSVTLSDTTSGAVIYYTTNGTPPTTSSAQYVPGTPLSISATTTIEAMAVKSGYTNSAVAVGTYTISAQPVAATPTFTPAPGTYSSAQMVTLLDTTSGAAIYYTTNGTPPTTSSALYVPGTPLSISATTTIEAMAVKSGYTNSPIAVGTYTISAQPVAATPTFTPAPGTYSSAQMVTLLDTTSGAVIYYTTNGTPPTTSSAAYAGGSLSISVTTTIEAMAVESGYTNSAVAVGTYTISEEPVVATPTFTPAPGSYTGTQQVTLSDTTSGAAIYYTTNGTPPTTSSTQYVPGTLLSISATTTIEAMAVESGYTNSAVALGTYTISASGTTPVSVSLASADNVDGIANAGTPVPGSGLDGGGNAYAEALLGTSLTWAGSTFTFGGAETADAVSSTTITLPAGSYAALNILATGVRGNQVNQTFVVSYSDGTTSTFTQSLSDWFTPQNYTGETEVLQMPYRIYSNGTLDDEPFYLYGYSFALNSAKTVRSLTLPNNRDVVVLAVDVVPSGSQALQAATPTFSPTPGIYGSAQSVTLSDTTSGALIYYTTNGTPPTTSSAQYVPGTPLSISATTTVEAIAVASGYSNSPVASGTYTITNGTTPVSVSLASADNVDGIANAGTAVPGSGMDGGGNAYAEALLGTSLTWAGSTFTFGGADTADAVSSTTITLPAGGYAALNILATGVEGNQVNQTFVVTYSDGSTSTFTQSLSDWFTPQSYTGETAVLQMPYRIYSNGTLDNEPFYLYGYSFALNSAKTVRSLTLPNNRDVVVLAVDLTP